MIGLLFLWVVAATSLNLRPIIGILSEPPTDGPGVQPTHSEFSADYVWWLSQAGARVVPVLFDLPLTELKTLFSSLNGILFTGGDDTLYFNTTYYKTAHTLYTWAKEANEKGDYFPIWGTCQGFQLLSILASEDQNVLLRNHYDSWNVSMALDLVPGAESSRFFSYLSPKTIHTLTKVKSTQNLHHDGVLPSSWTTNIKLKNMFRLLSTNEDLQGNPFGSTMEGRHVPFYATQWHPERNQFDWSPEEGLNKAPEVLEAMQEVAGFFVSETRKNNHKFASYQDEYKALIYNYSPKYTGNDGPYAEEETYYFPLIRKST